MTPYGFVDHIDGLVQDCSISSVLAMEILQSCTRPSIFNIGPGNDLLLDDTKPLPETMLTHYPEGPVTFICM